MPLPPATEPAALTLDELRALASKSVQQCSHEEMVQLVKTCSDLYVDLAAAEAPLLPPEKLLALAHQLLNFSKRWVFPGISESFRRALGKPVEPYRQAIMLVACDSACCLESL